MSAPIELVDYDPSWPAKFEAERTLLLETLGHRVTGPIEHVGSTAIPGLRAKPIIDIMIGVESLESSRGVIPMMKELAYQYWPYKADVMHWFCKPSDDFRTHHLHVVPFGSALWRDRLAFRDYLRANPNEAATYVALKNDLAVRYSDDREAYTDGKDDFVRHILALAGERR
jgi:GrpB-like predicted nucleotidyltransferase (UPF0157 family)